MDGTEILADGMQLSDSGDALKTRIADITGHMEAGLKLIFNGGILRDETVLAEKRIKHLSVVHCQVCPCVRVCV